MQFNDISGGQGICQEIDSLCDSDAQSYQLVDKARRTNTAVQELELIALMADGTWQFDDKNFTTNPTGLMTAVDGQVEYDFDSTLLFLERIDILQPDGVTWLKLKEYDEINGPLTATDLAVQATPQAYYKRGNKFGFTTVPKAANMTLAHGIKVWFKRTASLFTAADTTKEPGIVSPYHALVAQKASLPYCKTYKKDRVPQLLLDITAGEKSFKTYIARRGKDNSGGMRMRRINSR